MIVAVLAIVAIVVWDRLGAPDDAAPMVASGDTATSATGTPSTTETAATAPASAPAVTTTPSFDVVHREVLKTRKQMENALAS